MKVNRLLNDIAKGQWAMSIEGYLSWAPLAYRIISGEVESLEVTAPSLINYFDSNLNAVLPDEKGTVIIPKNSVAVVNLIGPMVKYGDMCTWGANEIAGKLLSLEADSRIKAIIIDCDGPGGSVSAIPYFKDFGAIRKKPLGVRYDSMCSAHLWSMYALRPDFVWAGNDVSSTVGSVGVMLSFVDNRKYLSEKGIAVHEIYADESSDKNKAFLLALDGKYELIKKEMLNPMAQKFQADVMAFRPQIKKEVPGTLTGKTFLAEEAIAYGFADRVGSLQEAINYAQILTEIRV